jgi:hypothetical protein
MNLSEKLVLAEMEVRLFLLLKQYYNLQGNPLQIFEPLSGKRSELQKSQCQKPKRTPKTP